jgi:transcriptional regulator with XRE-family HTH domain
MSRIPLGPLGADSLGDYLREQRQSAKLSLRQLSELAGVSNPYLSQIERGLKKPSAEILQQLAKGLEVSAESLYVRAGILDERHGHEAERLDTRAVIGADPQLTARQKAALLDIYDSFVGAAEQAPRRSRARTPSSATRTSTTRKSTRATPTQGD